MKSADTLLQHLAPFAKTGFTTAQAAEACGMSVDAMQSELAEMDAVGKVQHLARDAWMLLPKQMGSHCLPGLLRPGNCYLSLYTALKVHDMIDPIPNAVHAVSTGPAETVPTSLMDVVFHHVDPSFYFGFEPHPYVPQVQVATPEKAILDRLYLEATGAFGITHPVEIELPDGFSWERAGEMANRISDPGRNAFLLKRLDDWKGYVRQFEADRAKGM